MTSRKRADKACDLEDGTRFHVPSEDISRPGKGVRASLQGRSLSLWLSLEDSEQKQKQATTSQKV